MLGAAKQEFHSCGNQSQMYFKIRFRLNSSLR